MSFNHYYSEIKENDNCPTRDRNLPIWQGLSQNVISRAGTVVRRVVPESRDFTKPFVDIYESLRNMGTCVRGGRRIVTRRGRAMSQGERGGDSPRPTDAELASCVCSGSAGRAPCARSGRC